MNSIITLALELGITRPLVWTTSKTGTHSLHCSETSEHIHSVFRLVECIVTLHFIHCLSLHNGNVLTGSVSRCGYKRHDIMTRSFFS